MLIECRRETITKTHPWNKDAQSMNEMMLPFIVTMLK